MLSRDFFKNVLTLVSGTSLAQLIPIVIMPILTRVYDPSEIGVLASYLAIIFILSIFLTMRLDMAILLIESDKHATYLLAICLRIAFYMSIVLLLIILLAYFIGDINNYSVKLWWFLIPISGFFAACYMLFLAWLNRLREYKQMSASRVVQSGSISVLQVIGSAYSFGGLSLLLADLIGRIISIKVLFKKRIQITFSSLSKKSKKQIALLRRYREFPQKMMPASLFNVFAHQTPFLIIPFMFGEAVTGIYFLVYRVMLLPNSLIASAVTEVFRMQAIDEINEKGNCTDLFKKTVKFLFLVALIPFLIIIVFAPVLFNIVFGEIWGQAGNYARILAPLALLQLVSSPLSTILIIREKLKLDLLFQALFLCMVVISFFFGWYLNDIFLLIALLSTSGCFFYIFQIVGSYHYA